MLEYLDNAPNSGEQPNINFARELLELHTLGVDGGYTKADIYGVARSFTGWSYEWNSRNRNHGKFVFRPDYHDTDSKLVLGNTIPAGRGIEDGLQVIDILVNHPSTARFISKKLLKWFIQYDPPQEMIDGIATVYTSTGGDITAMLTAILQQNNVTSSSAKFKRPFHLAASLLRGMTASMTDASAMLEELSTLGQEPFLWIPPDGYPDRLSFWAGLALPRWDFALRLFSWGLDGVSINVKRMLRNATTGQQVVAVLEENLFGNEIDPQEKADLIAFVDIDPTDEARRRTAVALAICSPAYQWY
jgi:uncharacterized protein (DUF1800 family)